MSHDATNPPGPWIGGPPVLYADTMAVTVRANGLAEVSFGFDTGDATRAVATLIVPAADAASIGASLLRIAGKRRKKPA